MLLLLPLRVLLWDNCHQCQDTTSGLGILPRTQHLCLSYFSCLSASSHLRNVSHANQPSHFYFFLVLLSKNLIVAWPGFSAKSANCLACRSQTVNCHQERGLDNELKWYQRWTKQKSRLGLVACRAILPLILVPKKDFFRTQGMAM